MSDRSYVEWVAPIARTLAQDNRALLEFARAQPLEFWDRASVAEGWRNRDILAHVGGGNDQLLQIVLRATISRKPLGPETFGIDTDDANARGVEERRAWPIDRVIAEIEERQEETQYLFSQLSDTDRDVRGGSPMTLGDFLRLVQEERHDREHLQQLRASST
ncbi:MAG: maleylpyruvate isomerase N-terminal domain-containing protein [Dehalococcoidia bacterium]